MDYAMAFTEQLWASLRESLSGPMETAGVVLTGLAAHRGRATFLAQSIRWIPADSYARRDATGLAIASSGYVPALKEARMDGLVPVFFHTHPRGRPSPSEHDDVVDAQLAEFFPARSKQAHYISLIIGGTEAHPRFTGRVASTRSGSAQYQSISRIRIVGRRWQVIPADDSPNSADNASQVFDRQVLAFGTEGQGLVRRLKIGVVGAGGTGSAVSELLIRLGVGALVVIDDDVVEPSNLSRIHESRSSDVGRPKASLVRNLASRLDTGATVRVVRGNVAQRQIMMTLRDCDVVFGCTDDNAGRAVLSRLAYWYLIPLIDMGFIITSDKGRIEGLFGRVTTVMPGAACLICRGRVDSGRLRDELMHPAERARLAAEGYAQGLDERDPSVVAYTTMTAAFAVNELLDRLIGYGGDDIPTELLVRLHDRKLSGSDMPGLPDHYCTDQTNWGRGDAEPMLSQMWPS
jgi:ThiF family/Prokaryotic homologs of the JAB domain